MKRTPKQIKAGIKRRLIKVKPLLMKVLVGAPAPQKVPKKPRNDAADLLVRTDQMVIALDWDAALLAGRLAKQNTRLTLMPGPWVSHQGPPPDTTASTLEYDIRYVSKMDAQTRTVIETMTPPPQSIHKFPSWAATIADIGNSDVIVVMTGFPPADGRAMRILEGLMAKDCVSHILHGRSKEDSQLKFKKLRDLTGDRYKHFDLDDAQKYTAAPRTMAPVVVPPDAPAASTPVDSVADPADAVERTQLFSQRLAELSLAQKFELVHSVDLPSSPSGHRLARRCGADHTIDINEFPWMERRVSRFYRDLTPVRMAELNGLVATPLAEATHTISTSVGLGRVASRRFAVTPQPFRNFHDPQSFRRSTEIRKEWGAADSDVVLVHPCTYAAAYNSDECIRLVATQPDTYRLVFVGEANSLTDHEKMVTLARELGVQDRVHFKGQIPDTTAYLKYLSGADLGLVMLSENVANIKFGLTNRFVDLIAARVPIISTPSLETTRLVRKRQLGWIVKSTSATAFGNCVEAWRALSKSRKDALRRNVRAYAKEVSWLSEFENYCAHVPALADNTAPRVAIVFQRGLIKNRRVLRFARSLIDLRGAQVTIFITSMPPKAIRNAYPDINFHRI